MVRSDLVECVFKSKGPEEAFVEVRSLKENVRSTLQEVRRIIYDLRPMALDDLGLVPTLKKYLQTIEEYHKTSRICFTNYGEEKRLPTKYEVALFRLVQEAVQNALKHAEASAITISIDIKDKDVIVMVKDDGKGFDFKERQTQSFGILGMKERVELLEGKITIDSMPGTGTFILIQVPLAC
jgi:two-component system, NarL family, sensor histidine kinase DegS